MKNATGRRLAIFFAVAFLLQTAAKAAAFTLVPMVSTVSPSGAQSVMTFRVSNDSDEQIAVSLSVLTRSIDPSGAEVNTPADKTFLVFPARMVLAPKTSQNVKIQYRGTTSIPFEAAYRVVAEQLPVEFSKTENSGVKILIRYVAAFYVAPPKAEPKVQFVSALGARKDDKSGVVVTIKNNGTRHAILFNTLIRIVQSSGAVPVEITGAPMTEIEGQNVLAMSTRIFFVPWESAVMGAAYEGAFSADIE